MIYNNLYDTKKIEKEINKLGIPKEYRTRFVNLDNFFSHDYMMLLSIRQDAGKTTQALILGMVLKKLYNRTTILIRSDKKQITLSNIESLYDTIIDCGYFAKLYDNKYDTVVYKSMEHKFYLAKNVTNDDGSITQEVSTEVLCHVICLENWKDYKSNVNNPYADYIVFDEFMDTDRTTTRQMVELQNNISTFGRNRETCHILMLGNNVSKYCFWFEEFCIENDVVNLTFGSYIEKITSLGTTFICELMKVSDEHKEKITKKKIRFSGFNTPKMNAFNGLQEWQGDAHEHIPNDELLENNKPIFNNIWVKHRNAYIRINVYNDNDFGLFVFLHYSNKPKFDDGIILTLEPSNNNEFYGLAEYAPVKLKKLMTNIMSIIYSNRCYFSTNSVGELFSNYMHEYRVNNRKYI